MIEQERDGDPRAVWDTAMALYGAPSTGPEQPSLALPDGSDAALASGGWSVRPDDTDTDVASDAGEDGSEVEADHMPLQRRAGGLRLTPRDRDLLAFLVHHKVLTVPLVHRTWWPSARWDSAAVIRLNALKKAGLVTRRVGLHESGHAVYLPTPGAHDLVGASYPRKRFDVGVALLDHTLAVADVAAALMRDGWGVTGERRLDVEVGRATGPNSKARAEAKAAGRTAAPVGRWWTRARQGYRHHTPDLVIERGGSRVFVEVERHAKTVPGEYEDLLEGFLEARLRGDLHKVLYFTPDRAIAERVDAAAQRVLSRPGWGTVQSGNRAHGLTAPDLLEVRRYVPRYAVPYEQT